MMLGRISGSVTTKSFRFKAEARINKMQYIAIKDFEGKWILAYVDSITKYKTRTVATAKVVGFRDNRGFLRPLSVPFEPDTPVYGADDDLIKKTLGLKEEGLYLGLLDGYDIPVYLPPKHLLKKHVAVLAKTGTGKSYCAGVLLEELAEKGTPVVILDPHGEYRTLSKKNTERAEVSQMERFGVSPKSYGRSVKVFDMGLKSPIKLNSKLKPKEIFEMLPAKLSPTQKGLLYSAIKSLEGGDYTLRDIIDEVDRIESNSKWNLISLLEVLEETKLFSSNPTKPDDLVKKGRISIIDMRESSPEMQQIIALKVAEELFDARKHGRVPEFFLVIEEAHNFCPERGLGEVASSKIIRTVASEGRKFGVGLCVISQRPAKIDKNVLSQCSTQIILKVTNPNDINAIMNSVEGVETGVKEEIKDLPIGVGMVVGTTEQPLMVDIRVRMTEHGGETIEALQGRVPVEKRILLMAPRSGKDDLRKSFKGISDITFLNYPVWKATGRQAGDETDFYVDGITGEVIYQKGESIEYSSGIRSLFAMAPSQRAILLYLIRNKYATLEKISKDLQILLSTVKDNLKALAGKKLITSDGYMFKSSFDPNVPMEPSGLGIRHEMIEKGMEGEKLDFMVSPDFVNRIGDLWGIRVLEVKPVYFPYWLVTHKKTRYLINGLNNRVELEKSKKVRELL